jgi:hypothetical protein
MKSILHYTLLLVLLIVATACTDREGLPIDPDEESFTLTFGVDLPETTDTRGTEAFSASDASIKFLEFDSNHLLSHVYTGTFVSATTAAGVAHNQYSVTMKASSGLHYLHVLINHNTLNLESLTLATEADIFNDPQMFFDLGSQVYWQRLELQEVNASTAAAALHDLKVVRNDCQLTVSYDVTTTSNNTYQLVSPEWTLINTSTRVSAAPYVGGQDFASYLTADRTMADYATLSSGQYHGFAPHTAALSVEDLYDHRDLTQPEWHAPGEVVTLGENPAESCCGKWLPTVLLIRGYLKKKGAIASTYSYYRIELENPVNDTPMDLLRNIFYDIHLYTIESEGYSSIEAAYQSTGANDLAAINALNAEPGITLGNASLNVEYTTRYLFGPKPVTLSYRYLSDITTPTVSNDKVSLLAVGSQGETQSLTEAIASGFPINAYSISSQGDANNYGSITFTPGVPTTTEQKAVVRLAATDTGHEYLHRDITLILRQRYQMQNLKITPNGSDGYILSVELPSDIPEAVFPLDFTLESSPAAVYPNATYNTLEADWNHTSILNSGSGSVVHYHKSMSYDEYEASTKLSLYILLNTSVSGMITIGLSCPALSPDPAADLTAETPQAIRLSVGV